MRVIVSFTSYPPRINSVHKVVESLCRQTVPADEIVLYLSLDEFPEAEKNLPKALRNMVGLNGFRVAWVHGNLRSHKKYYYALQEYDDAIVITVDDDTIYAQTMISELVESHMRFPDAVSARKVRIILKKGKALEPYCNWEREAYLEEYANMPRMDLCAIGVGGICYPAWLFNGDWFQEEIIVETAAYHDDLWLKYNEIINNIPVVYVKSSQQDITIENSQKDNLAARNLYSNGNDECIDRLLALHNIKNAKCCHEWFRYLMTWEEYFTRKKRYYAGIFNTAFDSIGKKPVYFYGAGERAKGLLTILTDLGLTQRITAIIVSDRAGNPSSMHGLPVRQLSELNSNRKFAVIFGVGEENRKNIIDKMTKYNYQIIELDMHTIERYYQQITTIRKQSACQHYGISADV